MKRIYAFCLLVMLCPPGCCKNENASAGELRTRARSVRREEHATATQRAETLRAEQIR